MFVKVLQVFYVVSLSSPEADWPTCPTCGLFSIARGRLKINMLHNSSVRDAYM